MTWLALAAGCAGAPGPAASRYAMRGQLVAVQLDTGQVLLKHDAIPGYMDAMTMLFRVADRAAIRDRRPGDLVTATLVVESDASYLEDVRLTGTAPLDDAAPTRPVAEGLHILTPGDTAPDTPLTTHRGATVALPEWRGSAVAVTFIYTRCPLPDFCPAARPTLRGDPRSGRGRCRRCAAASGCCRSASTPTPTRRRFSPRTPSAPVPAPTGTSPPPRGRSSTASPPASA